MNKEELIVAATKIAVKIIKKSEGFVGFAYADPASALGKAIQGHNQWNAYLQGKFAVPKEWEKLSGAPLTLGYGETKNVKKGDTITLQEAEERLSVRVREFMEGVLKASPELLKQSPERLAAVTSLAYNIGLGAYKDSTAAKKIAAQDWAGAAEAFKMWCKAGGSVVQGLVNRRKEESDLFLSVRS